MQRQGTDVPWCVCLCDLCATPSPARFALPRGCGCALLIWGITVSLTRAAGAGLHGLVLHLHHDITSCLTPRSGPLQCSVSAKGGPSWGCSPHVPWCRVPSRASRVDSEGTGSQ